MTMERRTRRGTQANVEITENPRVQSTRRRRQEAFIVRNEDRQDTSRETGPDGVTTEHSRPGTIMLYKPTETQGYVARRVSVSSMGFLIRNNGWSEFCPDCGKEHLDRSGQVTTDPNACTARPPVAVRVCPVCRKRIYDNQGLPTLTAEDDVYDPNVIPDEGALSTPEQRTRILLDLHLWAKHPRQAQMLGRTPLPTALREIAESVQASVS